MLVLSCYGLKLYSLSCLINKIIFILIFGARVSKMLTRLYLLLKGKESGIGFYISSEASGNGYEWYIGILRECEARVQTFNVWRVNHEWYIEFYTSAKHECKIHCFTSDKSQNRLLHERCKPNTTFFLWQWTLLSKFW